MRDGKLWLLTLLLFLQQSYGLVERRKGVVFAFL